MMRFGAIVMFLWGLYTDFEQQDHILRKFNSNFKPFESIPGMFSSVIKD